jgi:hypothetical protein
VLFSPLITALMLTLSVIPCPAMAKSVKIPTDYRGIWCTTTDVAYKRCRKADSDAIEINAHHFFPNMDEKCVPLAIVPKGDSFLVQADCEWIRAPRRIVETVGWSFFPVQCAVCGAAVRSLVLLSQ